MDPPDHTRIRGIVTREFTVRRIERLRAGAREALADLLDHLESGDRSADLVAELTSRFPAAVVGELLGVSESDRMEFQGWASQLLGITSVTPEEGLAAMANLAEYVRGLIAERRRRPVDDLFGVLVQAHDEHGRLTDDELVTFGITLLAAGFETTADQMANSLFVLLAYDAYRELVENPEVVPAAVEELVRYGVPVVIAENPTKFS
ncbi:hypothetical protein ACFXPS_38540 [Nocardia sp. NPDC059091]|uniref:hypothetical protein n=1 Tax=unclassified Nocardia TaxID=2637762 RepID=UPI0036BDD0E3